jgi:hypothetical protein
MSTTNRVFKTKKVISLTLNNVIADALLADANGNTVFDISDVNWQRIVIEGNITTITGTNINLKVLTTNDPLNTGGATTDSAATQADGSTAFTSGAKTGTGRFMFATAKYKADGSACSNIGNFIEVFGDTTALTVLTGNVNIYVEGI